MGRNGRAGVRWGDVLLASIAAVSWALVGMAGTAALGLHLLGADAAGSLRSMTAAVVVLAVGGSVTPTGNVSAFGIEGAEARTAVDIAPLGVGLVGALLLGFFFLRSLKSAGRSIPGSELAVRAGAVVTLFLVTLGGLAWAGHDVITIDGEKLGLEKIPGNDLPGGIADQLPGDLGGLLPDRISDLVDAKATVGFSVNTGTSLGSGAVWVAGVLIIALLASRRTPLPRGWDAVHRVLRPATSALALVLVVAVLAGLAAALYAAVGDDRPGRVVGAALLGAPNGVWLAVPLGLFVPWEGRATGSLVGVLPSPVDDVLSGSDERPLTVGRLAELDGRVWLLVVAVVLMMLYAGVLAASRTPREELSRVGYAGQCAVALGTVTGAALPLLVRLTGVSADASLSVLGFDAVGAGVALSGSVPMALLLGVVWGAAAGAVGALLACAAGADGRRAAPLALPPGSSGVGRGDRTYPDLAYVPGPYRPSPSYGASGTGGASGAEDDNPYMRPVRESEGGGVRPRPGEPGRGAGPGAEGGARPGAGPRPGAYGVPPPAGRGERVEPPPAGSMGSVPHRKTKDGRHAAPTITGIPGPPRAPGAPGKGRGGGQTPPEEEGPPPPGAPGRGRR
ncbi:streptophobe family protein [Streptomyces sp. NBC_00237]|uniref:streptophobe family protein n=1 Tax=Streptomyces sp. NBC_00237 TaxID=2975687 RepID=UPI002255F3B9|nr:streptophobe family protein [Streptomyces sp. NBC_00237]MCX5202098.1 streptophobe family protein [Streptomyces sp. NBC_00237]